jgi:hypothetical protein
MNATLPSTPAASAKARTRRPPATEDPSWLARHEVIAPHRGGRP